MADKKLQGVRANNLKTFFQDLFCFRALPKKVNKVHITSCSPQEPNWAVQELKKSTSSS